MSILKVTLRNSKTPHNIEYELPQEPFQSLQAFLSTVGPNPKN